VLDRLEGESAAVVSAHAEVHLEAPVVDLVLVVGAQVADGAQVGAAQLATRERAPTDAEVSPERRRPEHVEPVSADARAGVSVGQRQHRVDLLEHDDRRALPHDRRRMLAVPLPRGSSRQISGAAAARSVGFRV